MQAQVFAWTVVSHWHASIAQPLLCVHLTALLQPWVITKISHNVKEQQQTLWLAFRGTLISLLFPCEETLCVILTQSMCHLFWSSMLGIWSSHLQQIYEPETSQHLSNQSWLVHLGLFSRKPCVITFILWERNRKPTCCLINLLPVPTVRCRAGAVGQCSEELPSAPTPPLSLSLSQSVSVWPPSYLPASTTQHTVHTHLHSCTKDLVKDEWETTCSLAQPVIYGL